jgi:hypothetical protein
VCPQLQVKRIRCGFRAKTSDSRGAACVHLTVWCNCDALTVHCGFKAQHARGRRLSLHGSHRGQVHRVGMGTPPIKDGVLGGGDGSVDLSEGGAGASAGEQVQGSGV